MTARLKNLFSRWSAALLAILTADTYTHATEEWGGMDWFIM